MNAFTTVDDYIAALPPARQAVVRELRTFLLKLVPEGEETISYAMPTIKLGGHPVVYYAGAEKHLGLYPTSGPIATLADQLSDYSHSKGTVRFPYDRPLPYDLIAALVKARIAELNSGKK